MEYIGNELELFSDARNWKRYFITSVHRFIQGDVLDVGAGQGATLVTFLGISNSYQVSKWTCLEPDSALCHKIKNNAQTAAAHAIDFVIINGTIEADDVADVYDTILYVDVLEHIEDDYEEISRAARRLRPDGHLIVIAPAHNFLHSALDSAVGHFRRYNRHSIDAISQNSLSLVECFYLDSLGMFLSLANRFFLKRNVPSKRQIRFWDHFIIPISRLIDKLTRNSVGKTIVAVWKKDP